MESNIKDTLREAYDKFAQDREKGEIQDWKIEIRDKFLARLKAESKNTLLEIGSGPGRDSKFFQESGLQVTAVDLSGEMVRLCREKGIKAHQLDFYRLSDLNETFDGIWALNCLLHVEKKNLGLVLEEIKKVLKPEGLFFMGVYGGKDSEGIYEDDFYTPKRFFSFFTDEGIKEVVSKHFEIVSFESIETGGDLHCQSITLRKTI